MRQFILILAATGCAYQDDDGWEAVDRACADAAWTAEGWDAEGLPEPLASAAACQDVLAAHTGADALGAGKVAVRDQIVWSAWTLALAPMAGPVPGDSGSPAVRAWTDSGQAGVYESVVQRLAEAEAVREELHELKDGVWGAVEGLDTHADMLPLMVHASAHWRRPGHDPCTDDAYASARPCDPGFDSPAGWEASVAALLYQGLAAGDDTSGLSGVYAGQAAAAYDAIQEPADFDPPDEDDDEGGGALEGIE